MQDRCVEIFREPIADVTAALGFRYTSHRICGHEETVAPLLSPDKAVAVASLVAVE